MMEKLLDKVLKKVKPKKDDQEELREVAEELLEKAGEIIDDKGLDVTPMLVGSAARGTWLKGEKDIDIFLLFPEESPRSKLEERGLELAREIAEGKGTEQFAEHPYLTANIEGFDVDIVPCYDIKNPSKLRSAVDRSPHHQEYVKGQLTPELTDQVLLLKGFLRGIGVYGAELRIHGFSGYLAELLIIHFESFQDLIQNAKKWKEGQIIDFTQEYSTPEDVYRMFPDQPLIVIDPVDHSRNVAAAVSEKNFATFVRACEDLDRNPNEKFFFLKPPDLSKKEIREFMKKRGTKIFTIVFDTPSDLVPDIIYPQLRKTERTLIQRLDRCNFKVLRSGVHSTPKKSVIVLELSVSELPKAYKHQGPPLGVESDSFIQKHIESDQKLAGPFIDSSGNLAFELGREYSNAEEVIRDSLESHNGFGKHVAEAIGEGYELAEGATVTKLIDDELKGFFSRYLTHCLPWYC
ncbi:hypothetical protein AKJ48_01400 [candidate division MSBL1 archaeon SCGC-AAA261O19]|uniref:CCA-adding enzyme n=1 Tax=candidate division MSBL1 archaeon SCGC-AAA261O19 TaxID=1698277 RepID=A0A133VEF7_9EURY|nr:hypothetical protein AKJ48_01400 [candidate division MSBL1 archaeon SCGC-AAA261O19]